MIQCRDFEPYFGKAIVILEESYPSVNPRAHVGRLIFVGHDRIVVERKDGVCIVSCISHIKAIADYPPIPQEETK